MKFFTICISIMIIFTSCRTQNMFSKKAHNTNAVVDSAFKFNPNYEYKIRKDDKVAISVWGQDELSTGSVYGIYNSNEVYGKWLLVDVDGNIEVPKIGTTYVLGKTTIELKAIFKEKFKTWINNPIIDVKILNKEITILGELKSPGVVKVDKDQNSLLEIIGKAGGTEFYANLKHVKVFRQNGTDVLVTTIDLTKSNRYLQINISLQPGDVVVIPSKGYKEFDKRISTIIPFTTAISAAAILIRLL